MPKFLSLGLLTLALTIPFSNVYAEIFQLTETKTKKVNGLLGTSKVYKAPQQINVNYTYVYSAVYNKPVLFVRYNEKQTNIDDLLDNGSKINNLNSEILKKTILKNIPKVSLNDDLEYQGTATVILKDIEVWQTNQDSEDYDFESTATIVDVIKNSKPKKVNTGSY